MFSPIGLEPVGAYLPYNFDFELDLEGGELVLVASLNKLTFVKSQSTLVQVD